MCRQLVASRNSMMRLGFCMIYSFHGTQAWRINQRTGEFMDKQPDPDYRSRISSVRRQSERSFGASLRRLRKQRGLRREDFEAEIAGKTIARIEQGIVQQVHKKTLAAIALRLRVTPEEIGSY